MLNVEYLHVNLAIVSSIKQMGLVFFTLFQFGFEEILLNDSKICALIVYLRDVLDSLFFHCFHVFLFGMI